MGNVNIPQYIYDAVPTHAVHFYIILQLCLSFTRYRVRGVQFAGLTSLSEKNIRQSDYLYAKHSIVLRGVEVFGLPYVFFRKTS